MRPEAHVTLHGLEQGVPAAPWARFYVLSQTDKTVTLVAAGLLVAAGSGSVSATDWRSVRSMLRTASLPDLVRVGASPPGGGGLDD